MMIRPLDDRTYWRQAAKTCHPPRPPKNDVNRLVVTFAVIMVDQTKHNRQTKEKKYWYIDHHNNTMNKMLPYSPGQTRTKTRKTSKIWDLGRRCARHIFQQTNIMLINWPVGCIYYYCVHYVVRVKGERQWSNVASIETHPWFSNTLH